MHQLYAPMKKEKVTISFLPRWSKDGTVYRKTFFVSEKVAHTFIDVLQAERAREKDHERSLWLNQKLNQNLEIVGLETVIIFMNLTQAKLFTEWIIKCSDVLVNKKRAMFDANTCLLIK